MKKVSISSILALLISMTAFAQVDRSQLPEAGPAPEIKIGEAETFTLENGLKVFLVENDKLPRVAFTLVLERDPIFEGEKAGYLGFVGQMMRAGTTNRTKDELDEEIDFIGANLSVGSTSMFGSSLKKHQEKVLELMTDVLYNPTFPQEELDKLKKQSLTGLAQSKDDPNSISSRLSSALVYGKDHPYGEIQTEATINNIEVADVKAYYEKFFKPNIAYLAIVGDMTKEEAEEVIPRYFSIWEVGEVPTFTYEKPSAASITEVDLVDKSSAVQSVIQITQPIDLTLGDENYIESRVLNQIFGGGGFSGRLLQNLREDKGYTYGANSSMSQDKLVGRFTAFASVRNEVTDSAVYEFMYEINKLVDEGVTEEELELAKASITGSFGRSLESPSTIANFALNTERYDLPSDYYATYLQKVDELTVEDINSTAKELIDPSKLYISVVGNGSEIAEKLERFGEVKMYDNMGNPAREIAMDASMTVDQVLANYIEAIGGRDAAMAVKSAKVSMDADVMGNAITLTSVYDDENKRYAQKTSLAGNVMQSTSMVDGKGSISAQGQNIEMNEEQYNEAQMSALFIPELYYESLGYDLKLEGVKDIDGVDAYKVIVTNSAGAFMTNYYAVDSGLKIKNENPNSGDTIFSEYEEKEGILVPMLWTITSPAIPVPLAAKVTSIEINPTLTDADFN